MMISSMHLQRVSGLGIPRAVSHMAIDRLALSRTPGLSFWKLLGTGRSFSAKDADPTTWGLFAVWESVAALDRFESVSRVSASWRERTDQTWRATLEPMRWKGEWAGKQPFGVDVERGSPTIHPAGDPVAALTRARIRPTQWRAFAKATNPVSTQLHNAEGLCFALGIGEAPIGLQATFSIWDSEEALSTFAYKGASHRSVIRQTHSAGWYSEEMFSRFVVRETIGSISGLTDSRDPV
jgi:hypothetical protein